MNQGDRYVKLLEWSDAKAVFAELCKIIEDTIELYEREGKALPEPLSGREFVNAL